MRLCRGKAWCIQGPLWVFSFSGVAMRFYLIFLLAAFSIMGLCVVLMLIISRIYETYLPVC
ncbi:Uncharacterised protein [Cedecea neteri]|uniref:Uncharacterized protein n=1 Tax=Cedecea neteri TaxID=158822 RepID=A0A2X3IWY6_9ENTR|nr:Uncharacterised protein [Cedecea neteri]